MPTRRPRAASAISSPIPKTTCRMAPSASAWPAFRVAVASLPSSPRFVATCRRRRLFSPMAAMLETSWKSLCSTWTGRPLRPSDGQSRRKGLPSFQDAGWRREGFDTILYDWLIYIGIDAISVADSEFHFTNTPNAIESAPDLTHSSGHKSSIPSQDSVTIKTPCESIC